MIFRLCAPAPSRDRRQLALAHQPVQQLGVVDDLELDAEVLVLVLQRVEAVRAGRDDLLDLVLLERLDVLLGEPLEDELVAGPAGLVAVAGLAVAEYGERHVGHVQQLGHRAGGLLLPVLVGAGAADPEQPLDLVERLDVLADHLDVEVEALGPVHPRGGRHVPGVALVLHPLEQLVELGREARLDEHLVAAHVDDVVDVLDVDRALLDARAAGHARPQHVGVDDRAAGRAPTQAPRSRRPAAGPPRPARPAAATRARPRRPGGTAPSRTRGRGGS